jgi:hypothetical protein
MFIAWPQGSPNAVAAAAAGARGVTLSGVERACAGGVWTARAVTLVALVALR